MAVVVVESPAKAKTIEKFLGKDFISINKEDKISWDEIKHIASENGYKISAIISQSEKGINISS